MLVPDAASVEKCIEFDDILMSIQLTQKLIGASDFILNAMNASQFICRCETDGLKLIETVLKRETFQIIDRSCFDPTHNTSLQMSIRMQDHVSVRVERDVSVEDARVARQEVVDCCCLLFREWMTSGECVAARCSGSTLVANFIFDKPIVGPVAVGVNTIACERHDRPRLAPVSVVVASVLVTVRVCNWNDVPVDIAANFLHSRICRAEQLVQDVSRGGRRDPFASVNIRLEEQGSVVLQKITTLMISYQLNSIVSSTGCFDNFTNLSGRPSKVVPRVSIVIYSGNSSRKASSHA